MEPTSFHTGPNKSRGQIHEAAAAAAANAAAAAAGDDTCVDSAFLISTVIFKNTHTESWIRTEMASAKRDVMTCCDETPDC